MERDEATWIFCEVHHRVAQGAGGRHLELEFDERGVQKFEKHVVTESLVAFDFGKFKAFIVENLLEARFGGLRADLVVLIGGLFYGIHSGDAVFHGTGEGGGGHLGHADVFGPGDHLLLFVAE